MTRKKTNNNRKNKLTQEFIYGKKYAEKQFAQRVKKLGEELDSLYKEYKQVELLRDKITKESNKLYKKYRDVEGLRTELVKELSSKKGLENMFRRMN